MLIHRGVIVSSGTTVVLIVGSSRKEGSRASKWWLNTSRSLGSTSGRFAGLLVRDIRRAPTPIDSDISIESENDHAYRRQ